MGVPASSIFWEDGDAVFLVRNWRQRQHADTTPVLMKLNERQVSTYGVAKLEGRSEQEIFSQLFAPAKPRIERVERRPATARIDRGTARVRKGTARIQKGTARVAKPATLGDDQLATMIRELTGEKMPYLAKLTPAELSHLYEVLLRLKTSFS
jgi:hypothetical protein